MKHLFLFLFSLPIFAQIQGKVIDATGIPVPYVNIRVEHENIGGTSETDGTFKIQAASDKTLVFSAIGFQTLQSKITEDGKIVLQPLAYQLDEVVISKPKETIKIEIGDAKKERFYPEWMHYPYVYAKFFPYQTSYEHTNFIQEVSVFTYSHIEGASFKLRIYSVAENGSPKEDLIHESIIVKVKKGKKKTSVDLSSYHLILPKEGVFVGFEQLIIEENKYEYVYKDRKTNKKTRTHYYEPTIGNNFFTSELGYTFGMDRWIKQLKIHQDGIQAVCPAINLTLTN